jgi:hypothetical protein
MKEILSWLKATEIIELRRKFILSNQKLTKFLKQLKGKSLFKIYYMKKLLEEKLNRNKKNKKPLTHRSQ